MSFQSLRRVLRSARKGLCSTCSKAKYPQLEAAGGGHVGCLIYTFETLGQLIKDDHDVTAVHVAARKGQIAILIYLIENNLVEGVNRAKNGATPAHDAAGTGHFECLRYLISHTKVSVNDTDINNSTPLHWAVQSGHLKIVAWLVLEAKAPIDCMAKNGITPLHIASSKNNLDIVKWLVRHAYKNYPKPRRLINAKDRNGATTLYHAAHAGHINVIQWLAEKAGADPTIRSHQGLAPLHAATIAGHLKAVQYLFQYGSASAPGGLRSAEGACSLHFAAAEGLSDILRWLLEQKECTGNERDYYQSTPMHDAAEKGNLKNVQMLYERGADFSLTDVEGNTPLDLAEKNGQTKTAKYLNNMKKQKGRSESSNDGKRSGKLSRNKHTSAELIDSYRNAPPHQIPVNIFEGDEDDAIDGEEDSPWATLRDLMGEEEIDGMSGAQDIRHQLSDADRKRRKLEEDMRKEAEERRRKRDEMLMRETDIEEEIRNKLFSEEPDFELKEAATDYLRSKQKSSEAPGNKHQDIKRRLSLPSNLSTDAELSQRGLVEKRTKEFEQKTPRTSQKKKLLAKLRFSKKSTPRGNTSKHLSHSQSWDSGIGGSIPPDETEDGFADEEDIPEPPPVPTVEYLLGKRPVNLRKRASDSLKHEMKLRSAGLVASEQKGDEGKEMNAEDVYDSDGHSSVGSSKGSKKHRRRKEKQKRKKRRGSKDDDESSSKDDDESVQWNYNKLSIPQSSPPRERKMFLGMERHPTPIPKQSTQMNGLPVPHHLDFSSAFDEVTKELELAAYCDSSDTPSSLSPLNSPSPKSPVSPTQLSPLHTATPTTAENHVHRPAPPPPPSAALRKSDQPKRAAPKLPPHLQNKMVMAANSNKNNNETLITNQAVKKSAPIAKIVSSRNKSAQQRSQVKTEGPPSQNANIVQPKSPSAFMAALTEAVSSSPKLPRFMRQEGASDTSPRSESPTIDDIEQQINEMQRTLALTSTHVPTSILPPSPDPAAVPSDSDSSEYTSSSEESSETESDDESSSEDEDITSKRPSGPRRPIMVRNIGMSMGRSRGNGVFNRARLLARYPRLLSKKFMKLMPITEVPEEILYGAETHEEQAVILHRLVVEKKFMKGWRRYMQIMRSAYRKAEKIIQRKKRDLLARSFYAWIQVRNIGTVEKVDTDRALFNYQIRLMRKVFNAWQFSKHGARMPIAKSTSMQLLGAEDRYLYWMNKQLKSATGTQIGNIEESLASGVLIIKAVSHASNTKPPKYHGNPKVRLHRQDNWKTAHEYMKRVDINMYGNRASRSCQHPSCSHT